MLAFKAGLCQNASAAQLNVKTIGAEIFLISDHKSENELWIIDFFDKDDVFVVRRTTASFPRFLARLQPDKDGSGKDLVPIRPVAMMATSFEGKVDEMYQLV